MSFNDSIPYFRDCLDCCIGRYWCSDDVANDITDASVCDALCAEDEDVVTGDVTGDITCGLPDDVDDGVLDDVADITDGIVTDIQWGIDDWSLVVVWLLDDWVFLNISTSCSVREKY